MRAPISVIVPTLNACGWLPASLASMIEGLDAGLIRELIVVDGGSTDGTVKMATAAGAEVVTTGHADAIKVAKGDWLLLLQPGVQLRQGWAQVVLDHITHKGTAGYFGTTARRGPARWLAGLFRAVPPHDALLVPSAMTRSGGAELHGAALCHALRGRLQPLDALADAVRR